MFRARGERSSPHPSSPGDGGTRERSLGLGDDGATAAWRARPISRTTADAADVGAGLFGISMSESKRDDVRWTSPWTIHALAIAQPGTRLPFCGATSSAGRSGCCAVLRVLVAGGALRGGGGGCWGSLGGQVALACGLSARLEVVSGPGTCGWASFGGSLRLERKFSLGLFSSHASGVGEGEATSARVLTCCSRSSSTKSLVRARVPRQSTQKPGLAPPGGVARPPAAFDPLRSPTEDARRPKTLKPTSSPVLRAHRPLSPPDRC